MNTADENKFTGYFQTPKFGRSLLRNRIRGQDQALTRIVSLLQRGELGLTKGMRPRGSFFFSALPALEKLRSLRIHRVPHG
jgi:hypothetical protein